MRKKIRIVVVAGVIAAVGGIAIAARDAKDEGKAAAPPAGAPMAPQVPVAEVITRTVAPSAEYTGFLAAPKTVELRSRVGGAVDAVSVPEGSLVRKGQLLFQIDPRPFQVTLDTAAAQLQQAEVLASQAQADFDRAERLVATGAVARKTYDDAVSARSARQAQVQAAKAAVAAARLDLSYARVTAPIAGRVDRVLVTEGNLVSGGVAGAATLLTTIVSIDPLHVYFDIDEATYLNVVSRSRPCSILHDLGLTEAHNHKETGCQCFAVEGARAAETFAQGLGWSEERCTQLADAISLHLNVRVGLEHGAEAHLLHEGAALDVIGARIHEIHPSTRDQLLTAYPRHGFKAEMSKAMKEQAKRRPQSRAAFLTGIGFIGMIRSAPFAD